MTRGLTMWFLWMLACLQPVPSHLKLEAPVDATAAELAEVRTARDALRQLVDGDPLARSPELPPVEALEDLAGAEALLEVVRAVRQLEQGQGAPARRLQQLEDAWRGSAAVPLSRGYRLRLVESLVAPVEERDLVAETEAVALISPLVKGSAQAPLPRRPMDWMLGDETLRVGALRTADTWVLSGWLDGPDIDVVPVAAALASPQFDALRAHPLGQVLLARAAEPTETEADLSKGMRALERATLLALERAAADRDGEQGAWADHLSAEREALGVEDPIAHLLEVSRQALTERASDPKAAGGAVLAYHAARWVETCHAPTCAAIDRVDGLAAAGRWEPELVPWVQTWQVIALKEALDTLEVAHDTVLFPKAQVDLIDALLGTGAGPFSADLFRYRSAVPALWLALGRSVGVEQVTTWEQARPALRGHLARQAKAAASTATDPEVRSLLERIARRAG